MNATDAIKTAYAATRLRLRAIKQSIFNDPTFAYGMDTGSSRSQGRRRSAYLPGTHIPWDAKAGDLWANPAVSACLNWAYRNFVQAPPIVEYENDEGKREKVASAALPQLLLHPNDVYDYSTLMMGTLNSFYCDGNSYWLLERGQGGNVTEVWWLPQWRVVPVPAKSGNKIDRYEYQIAGGQKKVYAPEDVVHFRFGLDPYNPLLGLSPLAALSRDVYTLQQAANYTARTFQNFGMVGGIAAPKEAVNQFEPAEFVRRWQERVTGDRQGELMALNTPIDLQWPMVTPQHMAIDTVQDRPEAYICSCFGFAAQCVGLMVGKYTQTYANFAEAETQTWQVGLIPVMNIIALQLTIQLLPQMSARFKRQFVGFDTSRVVALQPDLDALHSRTREDWQQGLIDRYQWAVAVGQTPVESDRGVYYYDVFPKTPAMTMGAGQEMTGHVPDMSRPRPMTGRNGGAGHASTAKSVPNAPENGNGRSSERAAA